MIFTKMFRNAKAKRKKATDANKTNALQDIAYRRCHEISYVFHEIVLPFL